MQTPLASFLRARRALAAALLGVALLAPGAQALDALEIPGDDAGDWFGSIYGGGVAFGDFNGDGIDDAAIGAPRGDNGPDANAGEVVILYGARDLRDAALDLNTDGPVSAAGETRIFGDDAGDSFGWALAAGDVDGDGCDDLIVGARGASPGGRSGAGMVAIVYGGPNLPGAAIDLDTDGAVSAWGETRILGDDANDMTGWSVAAGDVDADGLADVVVGARYADPLGRGEAGVGYVLFGSAALRGTIIDLDTNGAVSGAGETRLQGAAAGDSAGWAAACGDLNGDGFDDVVLGAISARPGGRSSAGTVHVVYGGPGLAASLVDLGAPGVAATTILGAAAGDSTGWALAAGDVDADGLDDLLVGAPSAARLARSGAGVAYVFYGRSAAGVETVDLATASGRFARFIGAAAGNALGWSVAASDVDGDGRDDVLFGAQGAGVSSSGALYGFGAPRADAGAEVDLAVEAADFFAEGAAAGDLFGQSAEGGCDLDDDGAADFAAAALNGDHPVAGPAGLAKLFFGASETLECVRPRRTRAGDAPPTDFGPAARCRIRFFGGEALSTETVTLTRAAPAEPPAGVLRVLPVSWRIDGDRAGAFACDVTLDYTEAELGAANEALLTAYTSPSGAAGTWSEAGLVQTVDAGRNRVRIESLAAFGLIALVERDLTPPGALDAPLDEGYATNVSPLRFTWTASPAPDADETDWQVDVDPLFSAPASGTVPNATAALDFAPPRDGRWFCRVRARDLAGNAGAWSAPSDGIYYDRAAPASAFAAPAQGAVLTTHAVTLEWTTGDGPGSGVGTVEMLWSKDGGAFAPVAGSPQPTASGETYFDAADAGGDGQYVFRLTATDRAGNVQTPPVERSVIVDAVPGPAASGPARAGDWTLYE